MRRSLVNCLLSGQLPPGRRWRPGLASCLALFAPGSTGSAQSPGSLETPAHVLGSRWLLEEILP